jgi:hypothetical protein
MLKKTLSSLAETSETHKIASNVTRNDRGA